MKKSKSILLLVISLMIVSLIVLVIALSLNGIDILGWIFSGSGLLVLFGIIIAGLFIGLMWYKMRD
jgi:prepilin signal peptidase PulO-like enzyme (type II secretory pathway)